MKLHFVCRSELPRLAWCADLRRGADATVLHGPWVETRHEAFVEGAWNGAFADMDFTRTFLVGSGGRLDGGRLVFACPDHTVDRIVSLRSAGRLLVSNSIPFLLAQAGDELDPTFPYYDSLFVTIRDGLDRYVRTLPTRRGQQLELHYCANLAVSPDLLVEEERRPELPPFVTFEDYKNTLQSQVRRLFKNAADPARMVRFSPLCTLSRGYDSPAAAVFARAAGCREGVTITTSRGAEDDSGAAIGRLLGLEVRTFGRLDYRARDDLPETRFNGGPSEFASFADVLGGRIVTTGFAGGNVWSLDSCLSANLVRSDASGTSLTEFRLHTGFVHLPVPMIGATRDLRSIGSAASMRPWRIGGRYDRPIPRRIVEEAGVPREMFGMRKRAAGVYLPVDGLENTMSPASLADFKVWLANHWTARAALRGWLLRLLKAVTTFNARASKASGMVMRRLTGWEYKLPLVVPRTLRIKTYGYVGHEALLFPWGTERLVGRYRSALRESRAEALTAAD